MADQRTQALIDYLRTLAPAFFERRMKGASLEEVARLEDAAGTPLSNSHVEFLLAAGNTPARMLNPFLNDRDYCITNLLSVYASHREFGPPLPGGVVYFSSSAILNETIMLRQTANLDVPPEVGDIRPETGQFVRQETSFASWLESFAFAFRISQPEHQVAFAAEWDARNRRWLGAPEDCWQILQGMGFREIFHFENGTRCAERGDVAATLYDDGSGVLAGDDRDEIEEIRRVLAEELPVRLRLTTASHRMHAARE